MESTDFVKVIHFNYSASEERELWGGIIKELLPELLESVPKVYEPVFHVDGHSHDRHHCHHQGTSSW